MYATLLVYCNLLVTYTVNSCAIIAMVVISELTKYQINYSLGLVLSYSTSVLFLNKESVVYFDEIIAYKSKIKLDSMSTVF